MRNFAYPKPELSRLFPRVARQAMQSASLMRNRSSTIRPQTIRGVRDQSKGDKSVNKKISVIYSLVLGGVLIVAIAASGATAEPGGTPQNSNSSSTTNAPQDMTAAPPSEQADLSGTYTGKLKITGSHEMEGDGTITVTGNDVTIEAAGMTHKGRVYAVTTRGYTGVTMYFPDVPDEGTKAGLVVMARARKKGDRLTLMPVPNARNSITFK